MEPINTRDSLASARAYVSLLEWPVAVGHRYRPRQGCTCDTADCPTPGAHPLPGPLTCLLPGKIAGALEAAPGASLIAPTTRFDALVVPQRIGIGAMVTLDRVCPVPCIIDGPCAVLPVLSATGRYAATASERESFEVRTGPDQWIALPLAHGTRWDTPPWRDQAALPFPLPHGQVVRRHLAQSFATFGKGKEVGA